MEQGTRAPLAPQRHVELLAEAGERLGRAATSAGLDAAVPPCPGWTIRDLLAHIGGVHRWATSFVVTGRSTPTNDDEDAAYFAAVPDNELLSWYGEGLAGLTAALAAADPALECWSFLPAPSPLAFWARRQAHETAVHCADAESAAGWGSSFDPELAADGIDELLRGFLAARRGSLVADPAVALGVQTTDTGDAWTIRIEPDRRVVATGLADPLGCSIAGPASELYLLLWNRQRLGGAFELHGDASVLELWRAKATVRWA